MKLVVSRGLAPDWLRQWVAAPHILAQLVWHILLYTLQQSIAKQTYVAPRYMGFAVASFHSVHIVMAISGEVHRRQQASISTIRRYWYERCSLLRVPRRRMVQVTQCQATKLSASGWLRSSGMGIGSDDGPELRQTPLRGYECVFRGTSSRISRF
jgi:hypothetical protein